MIKQKSLKIIVFLFITSIFIFNSAYNGHAQEEVRFQKITIDDGLSQSSAEIIMQDSKGYIWIGTNDGLNRYDGREFKVYKVFEESKTELANNHITSLEEDTLGNIWIGSINGLSKWNPNTDKVTNYREEDKAISENIISDILITKNGGILVATINGLNLYDEKEDKFVKIASKKEDLPNQEISSIDEDEYGNIWVGTSDGLAKININKHTLKLYCNSESKNSISSNKISKVYCDKDGHVWIGTKTEGLNKIEIKSDEITRYKQDDDNLLLDNYVRDILKDKNGDIWVGTDNGLAKLKHGTNEFTVYKKDKIDKYSLLSNKIYTLMQDKRGIIWVGSYLGINTFDPLNKIQIKGEIEGKYLSSNIIHGIYEDKDGILWIGTYEDGINIVDSENKTIEYLDKDDGLTGNQIRFITGDENNIWVGTTTGFNKIDRKTKKITPYNPEYNIKNLHIGSQGYLWIGSVDGLKILNLNTMEEVDISKLNKLYSLDNKYIETIYEDGNGDYWIGTYIDGMLLRLDSKTKEIVDYTNKINKEKLNTLSIRVINEDDKGNMWIGTNDGLWKFDKSEDRFTHYDEDEGLVNSTIKGILIDDDGNPWVSTNYGISKFDVNKSKFINFNVSDGLKGNEFNSGSYCKNSHGYMIFGGMAGISSFHPDQLIINETENKVEFSEFMVNGRNYKDINNLKFTYDNDDVLIKFFLPDYKDSKNTIYYYKVDGIDNEWVRTKDNQLFYKNLSPGKYTLKVKAKNYQGAMSEENSVSFTIKPHLLLSPLAFIIYIIIIIIIIYIIIIIIIIYIIIIIIIMYVQKLRVKKLDDLVNQRTSELRLQMEKNNKLFDKIIKLERSKNKYFVNLSHELRTPLNVINATLQLMGEYNKRVEDIDREKIEYHIDAMRRNSSRLLNLINNIIDNSKIEHGNYKINIKEDDIVYIVEESVLAMKDYIEEKGINLVIDPEIEEKVVKCDKYEIERCIVNLVSNAYKFTPKGGTIEVRIKDLGNEVEISVRDTGIGIDSEHQKLIFDRFNQVIDKESEIKGGSGLGLTITKNIVEMHNGKICVESEIHKGSKFIITLPVEA